MVGFALETEDRRYRALSKLEAKCCDLMVANSPQAIGATDNQVEVLTPDGKVVASLAGSKEKVAAGILQVIQDLLIERSRC